MKDLAKVKLVFSDIDLTLLPYTEKDLAPTARIIEEMIQAGVIFAPASARSPLTIPPAIMGAKGLRYVVTNNGSRVYDLMENTCLFKQLVPSELALKLLDIVLPMGMVGTAYFEGKRLVDTTNPMLDWRISPMIKEWDDTGIRMDLRAFLQEGNDVEMLPLLCVDDDIKAQAAEKMQEAGLLEELSFTSSGFETFEVTSRWAAKGLATDWLREYLGVLPEETLAAGDNRNDVLMLEKAGIAVVPENGMPEALAVADYIVPPPEHNGVESIFRKITELKNGQTE